MKWQSFHFRHHWMSAAVSYFFLLLSVGSISMLLLFHCSSIPMKCWFDFPVALPTSLGAVGVTIHICLQSTQETHHQNGRPSQFHSAFALNLFASNGETAWLIQKKKKKKRKRKKSHHTCLGDFSFTCSSAVAGIEIGREIKSKKSPRETFLDWISQPLNTSRMFVSWVMPFSISFYIMHGKSSLTMMRCK